MRHIIFHKPEQSLINGFKTHFLTASGIGMIIGYAVDSICHIQKKQLLFAAYGETNFHTEIEMVENFCYN